MEEKNTSTTLGWNKEKAPTLTIKQLYAISDAIAFDPNCKKHGAYFRIRQMIRHRESENTKKWFDKQRAKENKKIEGSK